MRGLLHGELRYAARMIEELQSRAHAFASFAIAAGLLLVLSAIAICVPARRLATSNPIAALRAE